MKMFFASIIAALVFNVACISSVNASEDKATSCTLNTQNIFVQQRTSSGSASAAGKVLRSKKSTPNERSAAGSALSQRRNRR